MFVKYVCFSFAINHDLTLTDFVDLFSLTIRYLPTFINSQNVQGRYSLKHEFYQIPT